VPPHFTALTRRPLGPLPEANRIGSAGVTPRQRRSTSRIRAEPLKRHARLGERAYARVIWADAGSVPGMLNPLTGRERPERHLTQT